MAHGESMNDKSLQQAFEAAKSENFKLMFSFDYAGRGPWPKETVINLLKKYASQAEYFKHSDGKPLVSTFEGPGNAGDWKDIKKQVGCFFIPDWSSKGARPALELADGVADGLFNWAAWPWGAKDMDTYVDASYFQYLKPDGSGGKPYMMPVSPWFYTNMPGFKKNWLWRGDDLWHDRWIQVVYNQPEYVQIISWNDYGESHHIGPMYSHAMDAFKVGKAPFMYAENRPHDGWRQTLPFWIDYYKNGKGTVNKEALVGWYRTSQATACPDGNTTGNTASQLQKEFSPASVMQDKIFFSAVLGSAAEVSVMVGSKAQEGKWTSVPDGGIGVYHGSVPFTGTGAVSIRIQRGGQTLAQIDGASINNNCQDDLTNWNPWVGSASLSSSVSATPALARKDQKCIKGTGAKGFAELCEFNCKYGYCPVSSCLCQALGKPIPEPKALEVDGFPAKGKSENYSGLCSWACNHGYCPSEYCSPTKQPTIVPTVSKFLPPACTAGTGTGAFGGLCSYACNFGFCPRLVCTCTGEGGLHQPPAAGIASGSPLRTDTDHGLCDFACSRGYCPDTICTRGYTIDPDDKCQETDATFSREEMRAGSHYDIPMLDPTTPSASNNQYITIVNMTPYRFKYLKDQSNFYQMRGDFGDIPPGHSRQCVMEYAVSGTSRVDDKGEAYYEVVGTSHRFNIKARTHFPDKYNLRTVVDLSGWGLGMREYEDPDTEVSLSFVITGSETYGYHHSLSFENTQDAWMRSIYDSIRNRRVKDVVMPGTHDSGMSKIGKFKWQGTKHTTQTRAFGLYTQLRTGARYFDLRPARVTGQDDGEFHIFHVVNTKNSIIAGASGDTLTNIVADVNKFTDESPGEVIFLWLKDLVAFEPFEKGGGGRPLDQKETEELFAVLGKIKNRCSGLEVPKGVGRQFQDRLMGEFMDMNGGSGCVLVILEGEVADGVPDSLPKEGIYRDNVHMYRFDHWPTATIPDTIIKKTAAELADPARHKKNGTEKQEFMVAQWQLTPDFTTSSNFGLEALAVYPTNPTLYWGGVPAMSPDTYPNVLMQDYIGVRLVDEHGWDSLGAEIRVLAVGLNLYMASENCWVSKRKHPLWKKNSRRQPSPWNGIIFANGTVMDKRPEIYDPYREPVLRAGTVFGNGTVLTTNITNPFH
ncbi:Mutanase [Colletotrichum siamense]|nr:Mutanase [Colletotrichum siamense]